jgi:hypothetical protein
VAISLILGGCADVAFKRGGSSADFASAKKSCHQTTTDDDAYRACLSSAGWSVVAEADQPAVADISAPTAAAPSPTQAAQHSTSFTVEGVSGSAPPAPALDPKSGLETISVKNWWRIGVGSSSLDASVNTCVARLGPAHQPAPGYHTVTRALVSCLKTEGWHAGN